MTAEMITKEDIRLVRHKASTIRAMVIGDVMLDKYIYGNVERMSPEAPVPILNYLSSESKAGGAANVALNLKAWGCQTYLVGLVGSDAQSEELRSILDEKQIDHKLIPIDGRCTTVKTRVVSGSHHLLRIDEEVTAFISGEDESRVQQLIIDSLMSEKPDLIIVQDYNKGMLTEGIISTIMIEARKYDAFVAVDPKELNFFSYINADLIKPNLREATHAAQKILTIQDLDRQTIEWRDRLNAGIVAITLGGQGIFLRDKSLSGHILPVHAIDVVDVCGAGDAVICALTLGVISGIGLQKSGNLANLTGAYVCSHSGVVAVAPDEIARWV